VFDASTASSPEARDAHGDQARERIFAERNPSRQSRWFATEFPNFSEFRHGNHPEIHLGDPASFRIFGCWFIIFLVIRYNSEILSARLPSIEKSCSSLPVMQRMAFPRLIAVWGRRAKNACRVSVIRACFVRPHANWLTQSECHGLIVPYFSQTSSALLRTTG
jgi:hypothetical protein